MRRVEAVPAQLCVAYDVDYILSPRSSESVAAAAHRRELFKQGKFEGLTEAWQGATFFPFMSFVFERSTLLILPESEQLVDKILRDATKRDLLEPLVKTAVMARLVAAVARGNTALVQRCCCK